MSDEAGKAYESYPAREISTPRAAFMAGRASRDAEVANLRSGRDIEQTMLRNAAATIEALREQLAERDAVLERVKVSVNGPHPASSGLDSFTLAHISAQFAASPSTVLAEHDARVLEEAADELDGVSILWLDRKRIPRDELIGWLREKAAEYRKGAGQ